MKSFSEVTRTLGFLTVLLVSTSAVHGQVVINEIVTDERSAGSGQIDDTREFIELYNSGSSAVDISNWSVDAYLLDDGSPFSSDPIPSGASIAPGGYYVIGAASVPNVNYVLGTTELWPNDNVAYELRDASTNLVDALAPNIYAVATAGTELDFATPAQLAQIGNGWWGQVLSANTPFPQSLARYRDGRDTNVNGRDFGMLPLTPGASNNLPQIGVYTPSDVDSLSVGATVAGFGGSFVLPQVINPTVVSSANPNAIPASPQGGNAIVSWDSTGGGNINNANSLATGFDLYAYIDTQPLNISTTAAEWEQSTYGIGSTDPFFASYDPTNQLAPIRNWTSTNNGNTGIGWIYQRVEDAPSGLEAAELLLVDFGDGGDSLPATESWTVIQSFDMTGEASDWHRLGIDFDPNTGDVVARLDDQTFNFTTSPDLIGTFYTGYREALSGGVPAVARPVTFDMFIEASENPDLDNDGDVDGDDFLAIQRTDPSLIGAWQDQYGSGNATPSGAAVPEPASALLLLAGCAALFCRKTR